MINKILTISIAAYNVEKYIGKTLDSLIVDDVMDKIEVLIENDGSIDNTARIANEYIKNYPNTFKLINKQNGGYGSTINRSIKEAQGKYFKQLDGDDFFDTENLKKLVFFLGTCEADLVLTGRCEVRNNLGFRHTNNRWEELYGEKYNGLTVKLSELIEPFVYGMWVVTYKTSLLRERMFALPEHMLYTDRLYICYPLPFIETIAFQNYDVYCYRVGEDEQSISVQNRINHWKESIEGFQIMLKFYSSLQDVSAYNMNFLNLRLSRYYNESVNTILLLPAKRENKKKIQELDKLLYNTSHTLYEICGKNNFQIRLFRKYSFNLYWLRKLIKPRIAY